MVPSLNCRNDTRLACWVKVRGIVEASCIDRKDGQLGSLLGVGAVSRWGNKGLGQKAPFCDAGSCSHHHNSNTSQSYCIEFTHVLACTRSTVQSLSHYSRPCLLCACIAFAFTIYSGTGSQSKSKRLAHDSNAAVKCFWPFFMPSGDGLSVGYFYNPCKKQMQPRTRSLYSYPFLPYQAVKSLGQNADFAET